MIPASLALVLVVINLGITISASVLLGFLLSRALRVSWGARDAGIDAGLAAIVAISGALIVSRIDDARGNTQSRVMLVAGIAIGSVVLRHLLRRFGPDGRTSG